MQTSLLFGNGLNRLSKNNISWPALLEKIKGTRTFKSNRLPNTMIYERIILERPDIAPDVREDELDVKKDIADLLKNTEPNEVYSKLFQLNIQNYISTNYDYGFINSLEENPEVNFPIHEYSTEDIYSIRRLKRISQPMLLKRNGTSMGMTRITELSLIPLSAPRYTMNTERAFPAETPLSRH